MQRVAPEKPATTNFILIANNQPNAPPERRVTQNTLIRLPFAL